MNPARSDNMIIQSICLLDQLDKDLNTFAMRVREWYCWHFPELRELVKDNYMFARCASYIKVKPSHLNKLVVSTTMGVLQSLDTIGNISGFVSLRRS